MQKRIIGYTLVTLGLGGMALAGYIFATGTGGRSNLLEVISYLLIGATFFFTGINYVYDSADSFSFKEMEITPELEEVSQIQQQWRTIHIAEQPLSQSKVVKAAQAV